MPTYTQPISRFLTDPSWTSVRSDGARPGGEAGLTVEVAGLAWRIEGLDAPQSEALLARFDGFRAAADAPIAQRIEVLRPADASVFKTVRWNGEILGFAFDHRPDRILVAGDTFVADVPRDPAVPVRLVTALDPVRLVPTVENVLRVVAADRLVARGGLLVHSAGIVLGDGAHVFFGASGAGKTTASRNALACGHAILSDDLNALVPDPDGWTAMRVPFAGDLGATFGGPARVRLAGLHVLRKSLDVTREALPVPRACAALVAAAPFANLDPERAGDLMSVAETLVRAVGADAVGLPREMRAWDRLGAAVRPR